MPYIKPVRRKEIFVFTWPNDFDDTPYNSGELNYALTQVILQYLNNPDNGPINYEKYNSVIGAIECCKLELYRRMIAPYEDNKILENGDVYPSEKEN